MENTLNTTHGPLQLPAFLPDATRAVLRTVESDGLKTVGIPALMVNILHLSTQPGVNVIKRMGGLHRFMAWSGPLASDSGGFQIYSLINENKKFGSVSNQGFLYRPGGGQNKRLFTPEKSIRSQLDLGSDMLFCLDQCTHPSNSFSVQEESVTRTIAWAKKCKAEFERRTANAAIKPLLFAVIQGGPHVGLRKNCADALLEIGFNGFGFGGWPIDDRGRLTDTVAHVADLVPKEFPKHALGIGKPENIVSAWKSGYRLFDSSLPTRDARRGRIFVATNPMDRSRLLSNDFYKYLYIGDKKYIRDPRPLDENCTCPCCLRYSRAYLNHLFRIKDALASRLATLHNLAFIADLMKALNEGEFPGE